MKSPKGKSRKTRSTARVPRFRYVIHVTKEPSGWMAWHRPKRDGRPRKDDADRKTMAVKGNKAWAIRHAVMNARHLWGVYRIPAQVVIHKANGEIQSERTYGYDPKGRKG
jgi:hypothetical protein